MSDYLHRFSRAVADVAGMSVKNLKCALMSGLQEWLVFAVQNRMEWEHEDVSFSALVQ